MAVSRLHGQTLMAWAGQATPPARRFACFSLARSCSGASAPLLGLQLCDLAAIAGKDDAFEMADRVGPADQIALNLVAALGAQGFELLGGLDPFRHHRHAEAVAESDHRADDRLRLRIADHVVDEAAVDLDLVEGE